MPETNATILIPDISGFTNFITTTELSHGAMAINMLMDAIVKAVGDEFEVAEIEGDAVLLVRKGAAPSKKEILDICLKIFNGFHFQRKWMQQHAVCPCGACQDISHLSLKFVVHHGTVAEMKVGRFEKLSGLEMIIAHRLLKNSIDNNEYLLITEKLLQQMEDSSETDELDWTPSSEEYSSIGKVNYRFALLNDARKKTPEPPEPQTQYDADSTPYLEMLIPAGFRDVYMAVMNIPGRPEWLPGLQKVEQEIPNVFVGSIHHCTFNNYEAVVSPMRMTVSADGIIYAESCRIPDRDIRLVNEYVFTKIDDKTSHFACRFINVGESSLPLAMHGALLERMQLMAEELKTYCAKMEGSLFEPAFQSN